MKKKNLLMLGALFASVLIWAASPLPAALAEVYETYAADEDEPMKAVWEEHNLTGEWLERGRLIFGDVNNDGLKDAFVIADNKALLFLQNEVGGFDQVENHGIQGLDEASAEFFDFNNDGNLDLVIVGNGPDGKSVFVYENRGATSNYAFQLNEEVSGDLLPVSQGSGDKLRNGRMLQAIDYDNDGWMDLVIMGAGDDDREDQGWRVTALFKNNKGRFEHKIDIVDGENFVGMSGGSVHAADVNNDGYIDLVINGWHDKPEGGWAAYIYMNNGNGTFTKKDFPDSGIWWEKSDIIFTDVNGDGYADIVAYKDDVANLYLNNKDNTFIKQENTGLIPAAGPSITAGDINNDGFIDLLITGENDYITAIYYNNGDNTFTPVEAPNQARARSGNGIVIDINGDGNMDIAANGYGDGFICGYAINIISESGIPQNEAPSVPKNLKAVYNNGKFVLTWNKSTDDFTPQSAIRYNVYAKNNDTGETYIYAPVDLSDGKLKVGGGIVALVTTNRFEYNLPEGNYTFGVQAVDQADVTSLFNSVEYPFVPVQAQWEEHSFNSGTGENGRMIWGDVNNDGRMDMFVVANDGAKLFIQDEDGQLNVAEGNNFTTLYRGSAEFIDYNNDGYLDIVIVGREDVNVSAGAVFVYRNTGEAGGYKFEFDEDASSDLHPTESSDEPHRGRMIQAFDYDNDGWMDLIFIGRNHLEGNDRLTALYKNVGGRFERIQDAVDGEDFIQVARGSVHVADMNNDGYADIVTCGYHDEPEAGLGAYIYINNGDGTFTKTDFPETDIWWQECEIIFADINCDGYADLVAFNRDMGALYINNKDNTFTKVENAGLLPSQSVTIAAGDINNDGYVDLFVSSANDSDYNDNNNISTIYYNNGNNTFTAVVAPEQVRARSGSVNIVDIDGDGYLDLSNFGYGNDWASGYVLNKGKVNGIPQNEVPTVPTGLACSDEDGKSVFTWNKSSDDFTPEDAIRYNIYVQEKESEQVYAYAPVNVGDGKLKIGNTIVPLITTNRFEMTLPNGEYTVGIQAVDQSGLASEFEKIEITVTNPEIPYDGPTRAIWTEAELLMDQEGIASGRMIWGDYNNDGYLDVFIIAGQKSEDGPSSKVGLFENDGAGNFVQVQPESFTSLNRATAVFIDYDNDGDLDLIVSGDHDDGGLKIYVYENTGKDNGYEYVLDEFRTEFLVPGVPEGNDYSTRTIVAVDYNNDGLMDLMLTGNNNWNQETGWRLTGVFRNTGSMFVRDLDLVNGGDFKHLSGGSIHVGDINNDGYVDIFVQGWGDDGINWAAVMYVNNGNGTFTEFDQSETQFNGGQGHETVFVDINGDGYSDIVEIWGDGANLYINNKDMTFTKYDSEYTGLQAGYGSSITAGDINNDGLIDLFVTSLNERTSVIYYNRGDNTFASTTVPEELLARSGNGNLVDINRDGNLDISNFGYGQNKWGKPAYAFNDIAASGILQNEAPSVPTELNAEYKDGKYIITWDKSTDDFTPQNAIRYNIYIQEEGSDKVYCYAPADLISGQLKIGGTIVPLISNNRFEIKMKEGAYTIGVQAVDQADVASTFATVKTTTVGIESDEVLDEVTVIAANQQIEIRNNIASAVDYTIVTVSGQVVKNGVCAANAVETLPLNEGMYIVRLSYEGTVRTVKVLVH